MTVRMSFWRRFKLRMCSYLVKVCHYILLFSSAVREHAIKQSNRTSLITMCPKLCTCAHQALCFSASEKQNKA